MKKPLLLFISFLFAISTLVAAEPTVSLSFTTEGLYNFTYNRANWINILDAGFEQSLWKNGALNVNLLSVNNLRESDGHGGIADDLHIFSAIEDESVPLCLFMFGVSQQIGPVNLFVGVRNVNNDYFTSPWNSVFTSSVNGLYPCLSNNYPISDSPCSAMCLNAEWAVTDKIALKGSLYNGVASDKWGEVFRFNPSHDGMFFISELSYHDDDDNDMLGNYHFGFAHGNTFFEDTGSKQRNTTFWGLLEQPVAHFAGSHLEAVLHGGYSHDSVCEKYWGAGLVLSGLFGEDDYLGALVNRSWHEEGNETALELTYAFAVNHATIQPAFHQVFTSSRSQSIGMIKVIFDF